MTNHSSPRPGRARMCQSVNLRSVVQRIRAADERSAAGSFLTLPPCLKAVVDIPPFVISPERRPGFRGAWPVLSGLLLSDFRSYPPARRTVQATHYAKRRPCSLRARIGSGPRGITCRFRSEASLVFSRPPPHSGALPVPRSRRSEPPQSPRVTVSSNLFLP